MGPWYCLIYTVVECYNTGMVKLSKWEELYLYNDDIMIITLSILNEYWTLAFCCVLEVIWSQQCSCKINIIIICLHGQNLYTVHRIKSSVLIVVFLRSWLDLFNPDFPMNSVMLWQLVYQYNIRGNRNKHWQAMTDTNNVVLSSPSMRVETVVVCTLGWQSLSHKDVSFEYL